MNISITFIVIPILLYFVFSLFLKSWLFLLSSFRFVSLINLVHILDSQLILQFLHLYRHTHNLLHFLLCKLLSLDFKFIQSLVIRREVHKFVSDNILWILSQTKCIHHLALSLSIQIHIIYSSDTIFKNIVA
jgi:hypothetical protein